MTADAGAAALDASVTTDPGRLARKSAAAVDYYRREVVAAEEAVARLEGKAAKFRGHAEQSERDLATARAWFDDAVAALAAAESAVDGGTN